MPDWTKSMQQTFEFYTVDPESWSIKEVLTTVTKATINRDSSDETLASAAIDSDEDLTDKYVRIYLKTIQDKKEEKFSLGTFLCQTPGTKFDGKKHSMSSDGYSPLIELKEKPLPMGFYISKDANVLDQATALTREGTRAPVTPGTSEKTLESDFVSNTSDTYLIFLQDLLALDDKVFDLDDTCRILFAPKTDVNAMTPRWTYTDDNSSILYSDISVERDLFDIPNVVEVVASTPAGRTLYSRIVNDDKNSPTSIQARGREIVQRDTSPSGTFYTQEDLDEYARNSLRTASSLEYTISYTHGYCPVRVGDCVRLNYIRADLRDIKAKVTRQSIDCTPGTPVQETAVFTKSLWG